MPPEILKATIANSYTGRYYIKLVATLGKNEKFLLQKFIKSLFVVKIFQQALSCKGEYEEVIKIYVNVIKS